MVTGGTVIDTLLFGGRVWVCVAFASSGDLSQGDHQLTGCWLDMGCLLKELHEGRGYCPCGICKHMDGVSCGGELEQARETACSQDVSTRCRSLLVTDSVYLRLVNSLTVTVVATKVVGGECYMSVHSLLHAGQWRLAFRPHAAAGHLAGVCCSC